MWWTASGFFSEKVSQAREMLGAAVLPSSAGVPMMSLSLPLPALWLTMTLALEGRTVSASSGVDIPDEWLGVPGLHGSRPCGPGPAVGFGRWLWRDCGTVVYPSVPSGLVIDMTVDLMEDLEALLVVI